MEYIARHNISSGGKGKRQTIQAGQRFNTDDYPDVQPKEWEAMANNGNIGLPEDPNFASPTGLVAQQRATANATVSEGRSGRSDMGAAETIGGITRPVAREEEDEDEAEEEQQPRRGRRGRAKPAEEEDDL